MAPRVDRPVLGRQRPAAAVRAILFCAALVAATLSSGAVLAMAASLGGVASVGAGAESADIASCDSDGVSSSYATSWDAADGRFEITEVTLDGVSNSCDGLTLKVSLTNGAGVEVGTGTYAIPADVGVVSHDVPLATPPATKDATSVHILISG